MPAPTKPASALAHYKLPLTLSRALKDDDAVLLAADPGGRQYLLKIMTPKGGEDYAAARNVFHTRRQLALSMAILRRLMPFGLGTAQPVRDRRGAYVTALGASTFATLTTFVDAPVLSGLPDDRRRQAARAAGEAAARLHDASARALAGIAPRRPHHLAAYQRRVLSRIEAGVGRTITAAQFDVLRRGSLRIEDCISRATADAPRSVGLIHTDLRDANLCYDGARAIPIDFTRAAYGPYLYDLGEMCAHMGGATVQEEILRGYHAVRPLRAQDVRDVQAYFVQFLLCVLAERAALPADGWLRDTVEKLAAVYIPALNGEGFFEPSVLASIP